MGKWKKNEEGRREDTKEKMNQKKGNIRGKKERRINGWDVGRNGLRNELGFILYS